VGLVGWPFFCRQQHRQVTGRLRVTVPTVPGSGKSATSPYASLPCHNHFVALRQQRSSRFPGQAPSHKLWHDRLTLGCTSKAALARGAVSGHSRLTVHSSRRRFAARLNSRVRPMRSNFAWIGFLWIIAVVLAAIFCSVYVVDWVISTDTTVLPWLLLPAAGVILAGAFVAAIPGVIFLIYVGVKERGVKAQDVAQPTLGELTVKQEHRPNNSFKPSPHQGGD